MRLNVGIRRRLAPLIGNSRRRIELLNMLLFSLPGTPVLYYGDEIGMGDNIYLGDRDGVRTPMQWSGDRNAGFSRADFARLYAPPIMDTLYGYQAINVEAQQRDPSSLLQWMKRLIALRKRYKVFGRGTLEFLHPRNRKVLAYLREYQDERIPDRRQPLAVRPAGRARPVQAQGADAVRDVRPGPVPDDHRRPLFPLARPVVVHLVPARDRHRPDRRAATEQLPAHEVEAIPRLTLTAGWETLLEGRERAILERTVLPQFIRRQRWFGAKSRSLETVSIRDWIAFPDDRPADGDRLRPDLRQRRGTSRSTSCRWPSSPARPAEQILQNNSAAIMAHVKSSAGEGLLCDALLSDELCTRLLGLIGGSEEVKTRQGRLAGIADLRLRGPRPAGPTAADPPGDVGVEQLQRRLRRPATGSRSTAG